jgi:hypothetical protein
MNCPQRERLSCPKLGISAVNEIELTVGTKTGERFVFSELQSVE